VDPGPGGKKHVDPDPESDPGYWFSAKVTLSRSYFLIRTKNNPISVRNGHEYLVSY